MTEMLQKTENVANNVANENSQDLTSQWKKGELPSGWYYVQLQEGVYTDNVKSIIMDYYTDFCDFMKHPYLIEQVLAPVPTFEEWKKAYECVVSENEEITTLKELLRECKEPLEVFADKKNACEWYPEDLLTKIDEALK